MTVPRLTIEDGLVLNSSIAPAFYGPAETFVTSRKGPHIEMDTGPITAKLMVDLMQAFATIESGAATGIRIDFGKILQALQELFIVILENPNDLFAVSEQSSIERPGLFLEAYGRLPPERSGPLPSDTSSESLLSSEEIDRMMEIIHQDEEDTGQNEPLDRRHTLHDISPLDEEEDHQRLEVELMALLEQLEPPAAQEHNRQEAMRAFTDSTRFLLWNEQHQMAELSPNATASLILAILVKDNADLQEMLDADIRIDMEEVFEALLYLVPRFDDVISYWREDLRAAFVFCIRTLSERPQGHPV
ncbi:MAG: hypothetical protein HQL53_13050 [Magnetococcales bacterium]|nr:hypothetical protein [Magnetococcales bacterium]